MRTLNEVTLYGKVEYTPEQHGEYVMFYLGLWAKKDGEFVWQSIEIRVNGDRARRVLETVHECDMLLVKGNIIAIQDTYISMNIFIKPYDTDTH